MSGFEELEIYVARQSSNFSASVGNEDVMVIYGVEYEIY